MKTTCAHCNRPIARSVAGTWMHHTVRTSERLYHDAEPALAFGIGEVVGNECNGHSGVIVALASDVATVRNEHGEDEQIHVSNLYPAGAAVVVYGGAR